MNSIAIVSRGHEAFLNTHLPEYARRCLAQEFGNDLNEWPVYHVPLEQIEQMFPDREFTGGGIYVLKLKDRIALVVERIFKDSDFILNPRLKVFQFQNGQAMDHFSESVASDKSQAQKIIGEYRNNCSFNVLNGYLRSVKAVRKYQEDAGKLDDREELTERDWGKIAKLGVHVIGMMDENPVCPNENEELRRKAHAEIKKIEERELERKLAAITSAGGSNVLSVKVEFLD